MQSIDESTLEINEKFSEALSFMNDSMDNIFITGKAGTGKSTLLSYFIKQNKKSVAILAPTGVAALNVNGETIHSFFKFSPKVTPEEAFKRGKKQVKNQIYLNLQTIIIDEISMVRADLLDCIDEFLQAARNLSEPFGGVQMIFIGDLYQLPPVVNGYERQFFATMYESPWFFSANVFKNPYFRLYIVELDKIYRQKDSLFIEILNAIRTNQVDHRHITAINDRLGFSSDEDTIYLTSTNDKAAEINISRLKKLGSAPRAFRSSFKGEVEIKQFPTEEEIELRIGAQVMFVNNDSAGRWVNGSIGQVTGINYNELNVKLSTGKEVVVTPHTWDIYKHSINEASGGLHPVSIGSFTQIPVKLAWAITIHKSQGKTFEKVIIDLGRGSFASGQTYVALSRCRTLEGISLASPIRPSDIKLDNRIVNFFKNLGKDKKFQAQGGQETIWD